MTPKLFIRRASRLYRRLTTTKNIPSPDQLLVIDNFAVLHKIRNTMPAKSPNITCTAAARLKVLGGQIRACRKSQRISAIAAAEAAAMSRVTLHRIEKGEPAVTMGAYANAMVVLGLNFGLLPQAEQSPPPPVLNRGEWIPARIRLQEYPQLKLLAWQLQGVESLSPLEAWNIYDRNRRHLDEQGLTEHERHLINALQLAFGGESRHV
ncbi:helix-turn-helix domain-containing protein [Trichlorobacter sp.]|uniref:helix-turn-helix domain-containing protein n=1 Tax=Trichlorobacter sp. TaxID=2911007 RepID=UPI002A365482|nr:helix-turn-helix domain-containing protein [Trichlorobacter sp.]